MKNDGVKNFSQLSEIRSWVKNYFSLNLLAPTCMRSLITVFTVRFTSLGSVQKMLNVRFLENKKFVLKMFPYSALLSSRN